MTTFPAPAGSRLTTALINHMYANADSVTTTVTAASLTDLSNIYTIPASDAAAGTAYRLSAFGNGTWGSTAQTLQFAACLAGSAVGSNPPTIGSSAFSTSTAFRWDAQILLICATSGSTGTWYARINGSLSAYNTTLLPNTGSQCTLAFSYSNTTAVTQDTTVANTLSVRAAWGSTTGSPTLTCHGTTFERLG